MRWSSGHGSIARGAWPAFSLEQRAVLALSNPDTARQALASGARVGARETDFPISPRSASAVRRGRDSGLGRMRTHSQIGPTLVPRAFPLPPPETFTFRRPSRARAGLARPAEDRHPSGSCFPRDPRSVCRSHLRIAPGAVNAVVCVDHSPSAKRPLPSPPHFRSPMRGLRTCEHAALDLVLRDRRFCRVYTLRVELARTLPSFPTASDVRQRVDPLRHA